MLFDDITRQVQIENDLVKAEKKAEKIENSYRSLFENMPSAYVFAKVIFEKEKPIDFIFLDVNKAFERLTGLTNVVGKKETEVVPNVICVCGVGRGLADSDQIRPARHAQEKQERNQHARLLRHGVLEREVDEVDARVLEQSQDAFMRVAPQALLVLQEVPLHMQQVEPHQVVRTHKHK